MDEPGRPDAYRVIPRTLVFLRRGDRLLLQRRGEGRAVWPGLYNGLGGHVEAGEDIEASARREVLEETGLAVGELRLAGVLHATGAGRAEGVVVFVFAGQAPGESVRASAEGELAWVEIGAVSRWPVVPDLPVIVPMLWPADGAIFNGLRPARRRAAVGRRQRGRDSYPSEHRARGPRGIEMSYVITELCERKGDCVEACPVECIMPGKKGDADWPLFYINPAECIDCGACKDACPIEGAVYAEDDPDFPADQLHMIETNRAFFEPGGGSWDFQMDRDLEEQRGL